MKHTYKLFLLFCIFSIHKLHAQLPPVMNPIQGPSIVCSQPASPKSYTASASNSPLSYTWICAGPAGAIISSPNTAITSISFPYPYVNVTYTLYCSASNIDGTSNTVSFVVTVKETPSVTFSGSNIFCQGSSTNLSASPTILSSSSTLSYNWSPTTGLNSSIGYSVHANPVTTTNYTVLLTLGTCTNNAYVTVNVNPTPSISVSGYTTICKGDILTMVAAGAYTYSWNTGVASATLIQTPQTTSSYTVTGTDLNGCSNTSAFTTTVINCTGLSNVTAQAQEMNIYPNPNNGNFTIKSDKDAIATIVNELGQSVRTINLMAEEKINISGLKPGIYFIISPTTRKKIVVTE